MKIVMCVYTYIRFSLSLSLSLSLFMWLGGERYTLMCLCVWRRMCVCSTKLTSDFFNNTGEHDGSRIFGVKLWISIVK